MSTCPQCVSTIFSLPRVYFQQEVLRLATAEVLNGTVSQPSHNQTRLGRLQFAAGDLEAEQGRLYMEEEVEHSATTNAGLVAVLGSNITTRASNKGYPKIPDDFTITEKAPTRAFSWLKVPTSAFTSHLRHY